MSLAVTANLSHADDIFIKYPEARHITLSSGEKEIIEKQENLLEYYVYMEEKHADLSSGKLSSGAHYDEDQAFEEFLDENKERFDKERERLENQLEYRINAFADQTNADEELTQAEAEALIQSTANEWRVEAYNEWREAKFDSWKRQKELKAQQRLLMLEQQYGVPFRTFRQYAILNKLKNPLAPAHINNVEDAGFQLQAIKPDWRSIAGITQHNWPQRIEITDEYSINTATKLMSLLNNAIKQMPERSGEILQGDQIGRASCRERV